MKLLRKTTLGKGLSRRQLLKVLGVGAATAPLLPTLESWAQPGALPPKRLLLLFTSSGVIPEVYYPTGTEKAWNFPAGGILSPMERHKADMLVLQNLPRGWGGGGGHEASMGGLWTGNSCVSSVAQAPSVDQVILSKVKQPTDFQHYALGAMCTYHAEGDITSKLKNNNPYMIHKGAAQKVLSETDPYKTFDKLFAGLGTGGVADTKAMDELRARRKSVLDVVKLELEDVTKVVGREDRTKIGSHLESLREIEQRLDSAGPRMIDAIEKPEGGIALDRNANYPKLIEIMNRITVAMFAADRTRVGSLQYSRGFSKITHSWVGAREGHHYISHKTSEKVMLAKIQQWYAERFAELFDKFKAVPEGAGTLLDSTLAVYSNELALGWTHGCSPAATWWVTGAKGRFNGSVTPGRYLDFKGSYDYNQMLQTMCKLMGADVDKVGNYGKPGVIPTLMT